MPIPLAERSKASIWDHFLESNEKTLSGTINTDRTKTLDLN
jgi:hypothetical protein